MIVARRSFGLPLAMARHALVFALCVGAVSVQSLILKVPIDDQSGIWIAVAGAVGLLSAFFARRPLGVVFVIVGMLAGVTAVLLAGSGTVAGVEAELQRSGIHWIEVIEVATLVYLLTVIIITRRERRGAT